MQETLISANIQSGTLDENEVADFLHVLWCFILETPDVGRDDDFFELGGRSLQMMIVINHLRTRFGCEMSPLAFALAPTINGLAHHCCTPLDAEDYL